MLRGPKETEVQVEIMRSGLMEPIAFTITRGVIEIKAVPFYGMAGDGIGYVGDSHAPVGTRVRSPKADNVRIVVVESGPARLGAWQAYERDVAADYAELFGRRPPRVGMVAVMIDSDDTRGRAEALLGDLVFSRAVRGRTEIPNVYATITRMTASDRVPGSTPR